MIPKISSPEEYHRACRRSIEDPDGFWGEVAGHFLWRRKWTRVRGDWNFTEPKIEWFTGGRLNLAENCLDRHLEKLGDKTALIWEPNDPKESPRALTFSELHREVCRFANVLKAQGVGKGDRVCLYLPMTPEAAVAMLACARIGAVHSVVFGGFSASSLADRIQNAGACAVVTADGAFRGAKEVPLKPAVDEALKASPSVKKVIVLKRTGSAVTMMPGRDVWWHEEIAKAGEICPAEAMDSEDTLFVLYTSGSTGKPKGVVHTTGGFTVFVAYSFAQVFQPRENDVHWCTADVGWVTGHSYLVYGPLLNGVTTLMFEGVPTWPDAGRFWQVVDRHRVNIFYTAPTAIRALMAHGTEFVRPYRLDSLRVLGTVGEPINEEAWTWYFENIGKKRCPVVDTWWQTETGGILISTMAGVTGHRPSFAGPPLPGVEPVIVDEKGRELTEPEAKGNLCIRSPWPGMIRTTYGDHERCRLNYFAAYPGLYFTGDGCRREKDGYYRITGRVDDVINVSGHRIGTAEVENAIGEHPAVTESAVVGFPHDIKGQALYAFVVCRGRPETDKMKREIIETVTRIIGPIARPDRIQLVRDLPKTRSGKIMRRILRKIAEGDVSNLGDTTTLLDPSVVNEILSER